MNTKHRKHEEITPNQIIFKLLEISKENLKVSREKVTFTS